MATDHIQAIDRFFRHEGEDWETIKKDLKPLVNLINNSNEEYNLQIRQDCFNVYYQGNSLAQVRPKRNRVYAVVIHERFLSDSVREKLGMYSSSRQYKNGYVNFKVQGNDLRRFFQRNHLNSISGKIRMVHNGEEITMEQVMVTDNPPSVDFLIIDRQVADHLNWARADLLALKRGETGKYRFVVIEVKLGRNHELREKAGKQVSDYVEHIRNHIGDYTICYQKNYEQKKQLGLFDESMPDTIIIDRDIDSVEGIVVAGGYSKLAEENSRQLQNAIRRNGWNIRVKQMPKMLLAD